MRREKNRHTEKDYRYSLRKTSLGLGSVAVGLLFASLLPQEQVLADTPTETGLNTTTISSAFVEETPTASETPPSTEGVGETATETAETPVSSEETNTQPTETAQAEAETRLSISNSQGPGTSRAGQTTQTASPAEWHKINHYNETDKTVNFDNDWKFNLGDSAGASATSFDDSSWKKLDLPHDFSLIQDYTPSGEAESGYKPGGIGWYRKTFTLGEDAARGRVNLQFDGAYMETEVFINGTSLGTHTYGYSPFSFDLTPHLKATEENVLAVKVTNPIPSSRWYSGSGIYRSVNLNFAPSVHLAEYGVVATTPDLKDTYNQASGSRVVIKNTVLNQSEQAAQVTVKNTLYKRQADGNLGEQVATTTAAAQSVTANGSSAITNELRVTRPALWSVENPNLYILKTEVSKDGQVIQTNEQEMGFRFTEFDPNTGFKLNGQAMKLQGVSMHHDQGALGARAYYDAIERQFTILKDMGVNAVRVTHNPASRAMKDIANRHGMLLIDEAFDTWEHAKNGNSNDYARYFNRTIGDSVRNLNGASANQTWAEYHIKQMVKSGINDPSIIMWSTGNEVMEGFSANTSNYPQVIENLIRWVEEVDPTRPATLGDNMLKNRNTTSVAMANKLTNKTGLTGIVGYNYANGAQYDQGHRDNPNWIIYGSETASAVNSRGVYNVKGQTQRGDRQLTSYDQSKVPWGHVASEAWYDVIKRDFVAGEFVWTGFDYLGEPTPWNGVSSGLIAGPNSPKSSYFGIVDTAGLPKDSYYFYRSQWNKDDTTLHVLPAWEESVVSKDNQNNVEVVVYSNAAKVKLVHIDTNGVQTDLGTKTFTEKTTPAGYSYKIYEGIDKKAAEHQNLYLTWNVQYRPGTIKAIALDANDRVINDTVGTSQVSTFSAASKLTSEVTHKKDTVDDHNLAYVTIDVKDENNNLIVNATNRISVAVDGPAELVAMDNGNPVDHQSYQDGNRQAFGGKVVAILKMTGEAGEVRVTASADGLTPTTQTFTVAAKHTPDATKVDEYELTKTIYVKKGATLNLPTETKIRYEDGREETKRLTFDSSAIADKLAAGETFTATGTIEGLTTKANIVVAVIDQVAAMKNISLATEVNVVPSLPTTAQAYLADGTLLSSTFPVTWQQPAATQFSQAGTVVVNGLANVLGQELPVTASVRVAEKSVVIDQNVAPSAARLTQNITGSDTLEAIRDNSTDVSDNNSGGPNPTIWSNWAAAQAGQKTATLSFTYDTAQNIAEVVAYYTSDRNSLRPPKSATFAWNRGNGAPDEVINATATSEAIPNTRLTKVTYRLERPVPAVEFKMTVENSDETMPGTQKASVGISELKLMTALERLDTQSNAAVTEIRVGNQTYTGNAISTTMRVPATGAVTATANSNVGITVLPEKDGVVKIFAESEDKSRTVAYTLNLVPESPQTPTDKQYIPLNEITLSAGSTENRPSEAVTNANDFNFGSHWHSAWAGTDIANLWLTADTGSLRKLDGLAYLQRQDSSNNGKVTNYEVYVSADNQNWTKVKTDTFTNTNDWQEVSFTPTEGRYIKLKAVNTLGSQPNRFMSVSELRVREDLTPTNRVALEEAHVTLPAEPVTYTGEARTPKPTVRVGNLTLVENTDYTLSYANNTAAGTATVTVTGAGNYTGTVNKTFTINPANLEANHVTLPDGSFTHTGGAHTPKPTVRVGNRTLVENTDYTLSYANNTAAGTATVTVTGKGNYAGSVPKTFTIQAAPPQTDPVVKTTLTDAHVSLSGTLYEHTGREIQPSPKVVVNGQTLLRGRDYTVSYSNNIEPGTNSASLTVTGLGNYEGAVTKTFSIEAVPTPQPDPAPKTALTDAHVSLPQAAFTHTGNAITPEPVVVVNGQTLTKGTDYTLTYANNTAVGTATLTVTGKGGYTGTVTKDFVIEALPTPTSKTALRESDVTLPEESFVYSGHAITPEPVVVVNGKTLEKGKDYILTYSNNTAIGTAAVAITGIGRYSDSVLKNFVIKAATTTTPTPKTKLDDSHVTLSTTSVTYNGQPHTLRPMVTINGQSLVEGRDYRLTYANIIGQADQDSIATVIVTGLGDYEGAVPKTFVIKAQVPTSTTQTELTDAHVSLTQTSVTQTGKALTPKPVVRVNGQTLTEGTDYSLTYTNNTAVGTATVTVTGLGNFSGKVVRSFAITPSQLTRTGKDTESIPFETERILDPSLPKGQEVVVTEGSAGSIIRPYTELLTSDGKVISKQYGETIRVEPINKKVRVGTKEPVETTPTPTPAPTPTPTPTPSTVPVTVTPTVQTKPQPKPSLVTVATAKPEQKHLGGQVASKEDNVKEISTSSAALASTSQQTQTSSAATSLPKTGEAAEAMLMALGAVSIVSALGLASKKSTNE